MCPKKEKQLPALPRVSGVERPLVLVVDLLEELVETHHAAHDVTLELLGYEPGRGHGVFERMLG